MTSSPPSTYVHTILSSIPVRERGSTHSSKIFVDCSFNDKQTSEVIMPISIISSRMENCNFILKALHQEDIQDQLLGKGNVRSLSPKTTETEYIFLRSNSAEVPVIQQ